MALREKIIVVLDFVADGATNQVKKFRTAVGEADGTVNKFKAAGNAAFDTIRANAAAFAVGAGTALVGFGVKAVGALQQTALGAGELSDKLGVTTEEASRLQEVAGDLGIPIGDLEATIGRMNREAANAPGKFDEIGAAIARNKDGTVNVNETFLNTVDALNRIPDATTRAAAAQQIFGRSWQNISELVGMGADGVREAMASVESAKIIDPGEVAQARKFRDTLDKLRGMLETVALTAGEILVPALEKIGSVLGGISDIANGLGLGKVFRDLMGDSSGLSAELELVSGTGVDALNALAGLADEVGNSRGAFDKGATVIKQLFNPTLDSADERARNLAAALKLVGDQSPEMAAQLVETMAQVLDSAQAGSEGAEEFADKWGITWDWLTKVERELGPTKEGVDALTDATEEGAAQADIFAEAEKRRTERLEAAATASDRATEAAQEFRDELIKGSQRVHDYELALLDLDGSYQSYREQVWTTTEAVNDSTLSDAEKAQALRDLRTEELQLADQVADTAAEYALERGAVEGSSESMRLQVGQLEAMKLKFPELREEIDAHIRALGGIPRSVTTELRVTGQRVTAGGDVIGVRALPGQSVAGATGGIVTRPTMALIGEAGPEAVIPLNQAPGSSPLPGGIGGAPTIIVNAQGAVGLSGPQVEQWVAEAFTRWKRRNGER
jgi:hypothetical protein